jgi:hypothetical protein
MGALCPCAQEPARELRGSFGGVRTRGGLSLALELPHVGAAARQPCGRNLDAFVPGP